MTVPAGYFFVLSLVLFVLGIVAFFVKRDLISQFMAIEVMLNSANLAFLALARQAHFADAQVVVFFIITVAAAEVAVGLALIVALYRKRQTTHVEDLRTLRL